MPEAGQPASLYAPESAPNSNSLNDARKGRWRGGAPANGDVLQRDAGSIRIGMRAELNRASVRRLRLNPGARSLKTQQQGDRSEASASEAINSRVL